MVALLCNKLCDEEAGAAFGALMCRPLLRDLALAFDFVPAHSEANSTAELVSGVQREEGKEQR